MVRRKRFVIGCISFIAVIIGLMVYGFSAGAGKGL